MVSIEWRKCTGEKEMEWERDMDRGPGEEEKKHTRTYRWNKIEVEKVSFVCIFRFQLKSDVILIL